MKKGKQNTSSNKTEYTCCPKCMYFPNMECNEWVYDEEKPFIKRRKEPKSFICGYDGHEIVSWYDECPKKV